MRKFFLLFVAAALICPAGLALAQEGETARVEISDADRAAVAAYNEAIGRLGKKIKDIRKEIREKNSELAKVLGREKADYNEKDVIAAHQTLTDIYAKMTAAELESILLYKAYHPEWKPAADGRRVASPAEPDPALAREPGPADLPRDGLPPHSEGDGPREKKPKK
ncbi:hypothetical protein C4J81_07540 [Deltaproteobacteria bacterium Smac51]|nr:hypothetical protein C4J81_07540 [Deltaproteobacteria bacterium Smac51]